MSEGLATVNNHAVVLNEGIIKKYICPNATETEVYMFLQLCKAQNLNPFLREAYLIKYGTTPATIVTGKDTFIKRARGIQQYRGFKAGIIVISNKAVVYREGGMLIKGEELIGGWAEVYRSDLEVPVRAEVTFDEYVGKKSDGTINRQWAEKPATMIRKVALVQAHREAFPDQFEGMYSPEEMGVEVETIEYTQDKPAEGYKPPVKPPQEKNADKQGELSSRDKLINEVGQYCNGDEVMMSDVIKECSSFEKDGELKFYTLADIKAVKQDGKPVVSDAWIGTTIGKLRKLVEANQ